MKAFLIAEAGVNHNGSESLALNLVEIAARAGADAVKFQTFSADKLVRPGAEKASYQIAGTAAGDQYAMLKALEISHDTHMKLFSRCGELGIEFMSTPFDEEAAEFLIGLGMKRIKVPSGEITNEPFLEFLAAIGKPMIVSTGMSTLDEIKRAIHVIDAARSRAGHVEPLADVLTMLHCTSNYPALSSDVNLRAMQTIASETHLPVGYSDHTLGVAVSIAAVAMGATVIEKHFTSDRNLPGPDHSASLTPDELMRLVAEIRNVEAALGSALKAPTASELPIRELVRRSVTVVRSLQSGSIIRRGDVELLRPGSGIAPGELVGVIGRSVVRDIPAGTTLQWSDIR